MVATTLKKVELSWDDVAAGNFPENSTRRLWRESVGDIAERAKATLPEACNGRIEKAVQIVLSGDVVQMAAYSGRKFPPIPVESFHRFRSKVSIDSGRRFPPIPVKLATPHHKIMEQHATQT